MIGKHNAGLMRRAALVAAAAVFCAPASWAWHSQHNSAPAHSAPAPHYSAPKSNPPQGQTNKPQGQNRPANQYQGRPLGNAAPPPASGYGAPAVRPAYPGTPNRGLYQTPVRPGGAYPGSAPPGHLGYWLNEHRGLPVQDQERMLRSDPNFTRLPPGDQQRVLQQLHQ